MRSELRKFTQHEIIEVLKQSRDQWIVCELHGRNWFSDGSAVIQCEEPLAEQVWFNRAGSWKSALEKLIATVPEGYVGAIVGRLFGGFGGGYTRLYTDTRKMATHVYLNEMYVRAIGHDGAVAWMHPDDEHKHIVFTRDNVVIGSVMPLRNGTCGSLDELPEIPFLEDEALYYCNPEDE